MAKLENRQQLQELRAACVAAAKKESRKILVCAGTGCVSGGSLDIYAALKAKMEEQGIPCEIELGHVPHDDVVGLKKSGCHGFCEMGPLLQIEPEGILYTHVKLDDCDEIIEKTILGGELIPRLLYQLDGVYEFLKKHDALASSMRDFLALCEYCFRSAYRNAPAYEKAKCCAELTARLRKWNLDYSSNPLLDGLCDGDYTIDFNKDVYK